MSSIKIEKLTSSEEEEEEAAGMETCCIICTLCWAGGSWHSGCAAILENQEILHGSLCKTVHLLECGIVLQLKIILNTHNIY